MFRIKQGMRVYSEAGTGQIVLTPVTPRHFKRMTVCLGAGVQQGWTGTLDRLAEYLANAEAGGAR